jgi:hypothetical protein
MMKLFVVEIVEEEVYGNAYKEQGKDDFDMCGADLP